MMTSKPNDLPPALAKLLIDQAPDAMILSDTEGTIRAWNEAATRIFGFAAADALGATLDIIVPGRFRKAHWDGFARAMESRATKYVGQVLPTRSARSDGSQIYVELSFAIIADSSGKVLGALANARDITVRFEKERADRKRLQELEKGCAQRS